jgi:hypothetical protein
MRLLVTVRGFSTTAGTFSIPARDTATGASIFFGSSAEVVAYGEGFFIGRGSTLLRVLRSGNQDMVSCTGPNAPQPPGCANGGARACGPINKYRVNGTQVLTVKPTRVTLVVNAAPTPIYEGDTVTFTASSTDGRPVSVRSWVWQDSLGSLSSPSCALSGPTCKMVPLGSGRMFVRARIGTNPYIEQATTTVSVQPVVLVLTVSPQNVTGLDTVQLTVSSIPVRPIRDLALFQPLVAVRQGRGIAALATDSTAVLYQTTCGASSPTICRGIALAGGTVRVSATVNGLRRMASSTLAVTPLQVTVSSQGTVGDGSMLDVAAAGRDCDEGAGSLLDGYEVQGSTINVAQAEVRHYVFGNRNLGPGLVGMSPPFDKNGDIVQYVTYQTVWTPTAYYKPFYASLTTENTPPGWVWTYVKPLGRGGLFYCESQFNGHRFNGRITFANKLDLVFMGAYSRQ